MDPAIGYGLLAVGGLLLLFLVLRIVRPAGDWNQVKARDVSGQVVVADRVEGEVHQRRVDSGPRRESETKGQARKTFDWIALVLGILVSMLTIIGAIVAFGDGPMLQLLQRRDLPWHRWVQARFRDVSGIVVIGDVHGDVRHLAGQARPLRLDWKPLGGATTLSPGSLEEPPGPGAGRVKAALAAIDEAMGIDRRLASSNPSRYEPELAGSLNNLSNRLAEAGREEEALVAIREAAARIGPYARRFPAGLSGSWGRIIRTKLEQMEGEESKSQEDL